MNERKKYGVYRHAQKGWADDMWERVKAFQTPEAAHQCIKDLSKVSKSKRLFVYTMLPVLDRKRFVLINEEHKEQLLKTAR